MPRLWFTDGVSAKNPSEIAAGNATATLTGWWKAHKGDGTDDQLTIVQNTGGRGSDNEYYVTQWDDSSGQDNHLKNLFTGNGPQPFGSDTNHQGDSSDELNGYTVLDFKGDEDGDGTGTQNLYLKCNPSTDSDFDMGGANNHLNFICVGRHMTPTGAAGVSSGDWQGIIGAEQIGSSGHWAFGLYVDDTSSTVEFVQQVSYGTTEDYSTGTTVVSDDTYYVMGFFGASEGGLSHPNIGVMKPNDGSTLEDVGGNMGSTVGVGVGTNNEIWVGRNGRTVGDVWNWNGRLVEMAIIKSTDPLSATERRQLVQYFKSKFAL